MNILFTRFPLESAHGGAEVQTLSLMKGLNDRGHITAFLGSCPVFLEQCKKENILFASLDIGPPPVTKFGALSFFWRKKKMQRNLFQAVETFSSPINAIVMLSLSEKLLLTPIAIKKGIPVFWLEHDRVGRWLNKNPWLPLLRTLSKHVTTIVVSNLSKRLYKDLGWEEDKVIAIPNGIDPLRFTASQSLSDSSNLKIGCIARLTHDKGIDLLVEAVKNISNVDLMIVGKGREEKNLENLIAGKENIKLISYVADLNEFYSSLDLLVLPSREHDPFGLVAAEAMMLGIPVIVTDACGIADDLTSGKDALIVEADSSAALSEAIKSMQDSENRLRIGTACKETAHQKFTLKRMIDRYEKLFA